MDAVYFGRKYCYIVFRSWELRKNLLWYKAPYETNDLYRKWIKILQEKWWRIKAIVCDGRRWLLWWFGEIPTQMCIFHQQQVITRYLTKRPKLIPNIELREIWMDIWKWSKSTIELWLKNWYNRNYNWLQEKNWRWNFVHERTRKAYRSIKKNLSYLYTFEQDSWLNIPKTNNSLESINSHLKTKLWIHRWLKEKRKCKFIEYYLYIS
jgi:hypothetical protein